MFENNEPYVSRIEEECVMFYEPTTGKGPKSCRVTSEKMTKLLKAYSDHDDNFN